MDLKEIQDFIKGIAKSGVAEVRIETEELKLTIKTTPKNKSTLTTETNFIPQIPLQSHLSTIPPIQTVANLQTIPPVHVTAETPIKKEENEVKLLEIRAPMVGTFYRRPAPDKSVYVNIGDNIEPGKIVCVIEAMKLFNEIESEISGKIVKILVDDASPVEFDQPLFLIEPK
ncbi:MAG: acetyl-CoA carboxylase biotin carboxyl carrier protein [Bacteroidales bacterium]